MVLTEITFPKTLVQVGGTTLGVTVPIEYVRKMDLKLGELVDVTIKKRAHN